MTETTILSHTSITQNSIDLPSTNSTNTTLYSQLIDVDIKFYLNQNIHRKRIRLSNFSQLLENVRQFILDKGSKVDCSQIQMKYIDSSNEKINLDDQESFDLAISDINQIGTGGIKTLKVIASLKSILSSFGSSNSQNNNNFSNSDLNNACSTDTTAASNKTTTAICLKSSGNNNANDPNYSMFLFWKQFYQQQQNQFKHLSKSLSTRDSLNKQSSSENLEQHDIHFKSLPSQMHFSNQEGQQLDQQVLAFEIEKQQSSEGFQEIIIPNKVFLGSEEKYSNKIANEKQLIAQIGINNQQRVQTTKSDSEQEVNQLSGETQKLGQEKQQNQVNIQHQENLIEVDTNEDQFLDNCQVEQSIVRDRVQINHELGVGDLGYFLQNQKYLLQLRNNTQSDECLLQLLGQTEKCLFCQKGLICEFKNKHKMISSIVDHKITEVLFALRPAIQKKIETVKNQQNQGLSNISNQVSTKDKDNSLHNLSDIQETTPFSNLEVDHQQQQVDKHEIDSKNTTNTAVKTEIKQKTDTFLELYGNLERSDENFFKQNNQILKEILQNDNNNLNSNQQIDARYQYEQSTPGEDHNPSQNPELDNKKNTNPPEILPDKGSKNLFSKFGFLTHLMKKQKPLEKNDDQNILTKSLHSESNNQQPIQNLQTELSQSLGKEKISKEGFFLVDFEELEEEQQLDETDAKFLEFAKLANQANKQQSQQQFSSINNGILSNYLSTRSKLKNITEDVIEEEESKEDLKSKNKSIHHDSVWCMRRDKASKEVYYDAEFIQKEIIVEFQAKDPSKDILVELKNTGKKYWHKGSVKLRCLKGVFENIEFNLPEINIDIGKVIQVNLQLHLQQLKLNNYITQWKLFVINKRGNDLQFFGPILQIILIGQNSKTINKLPIPESFWEKINIRLIQITDSDEQSVQKITEFILKQQKLYTEYVPAELDQLTYQIVNEFLDSGMISQ